MAGKLTAVRVRALSRPGRYGDGGGLYLQVGRTGGKAWLYRFMLHGRAREMGLGAAGQDGGGVTLAEAREKAASCRKLAREGVDPLEHRLQARAAVRAAQASAGARTFEAVAEMYIAAHQDGWRNAKYRTQWRTSLRADVFPVLGRMPVSSIDTGAVMGVLEPVWRVKPEAASRHRSRIEAVLDYAAARGWRSGENPARWRGHLSKLLPARERLAKLKHHAALPWPEVGAFMRKLRDDRAGAARALEFIVLTAARSGEVLLMRWPEVDLGTAIWTVPAERMKGSRAHRVPLSRDAARLLHEMSDLRESRAGLVFPGQKPGKPFSQTSLHLVLRRLGRSELTVHGFRSTFRDWCGEHTNYPREVAEAALAHINADKTEAAYARGDLFAKRARMMEDWSRFCARRTQTGEPSALHA